MENSNEDKEMFKGDWKCSGCGTAITELPFQPDPARASELMCRDCHKKKMDEKRADRPMFEGDWKCGKCGAPITSLPFKPDPERISHLTCGACYKNGKSY
ncbi:hypothetical protein ACFL0K_00660 [Patescibacteria group bacterium]